MDTQRLLPGDGGRPGGMWRGRSVAAGGDHTAGGWFDVVGGRDGGPGFICRRYAVGLGTSGVCHLPRTVARVYRRPGHRSWFARAAGRREHGSDWVSQRTVTGLRLVRPPPFSISDGPTGGFFRDGRASSLATQAQQPFITAFEMANDDAAEVVGRLQQSAASLQKFIAAYGEAGAATLIPLCRTWAWPLRLTRARIRIFIPSAASTTRGSRGEAQLTAQEQQGLTLFNDPTKGNCTACHPSQRQGYSSLALFTDFTFDNIGGAAQLGDPGKYTGVGEPDRRLGVDGASAGRCSVGR